MAKKLKYEIFIEEGNDGAISVEVYERNGLSATLVGSAFGYGEEYTLPLLADEVFGVTEYHQSFEEQL